MRADDVVAFREGVVLQKPTKPGKGSFVNVGLYSEVQIDKALQPGVRVTIRMDLGNAGTSYKYLGCDFNTVCKDLRFVQFGKFVHVNIIFSWR